MPSQTTLRTLAALGIPLAVTAGTAVIVTGAGSAPADDAATEAAAVVDIAALLADDRSLDGTGNNRGDPTLGAAGEVYPRVADANYADGVGALVDSPSARYLSNRIFNDTNANLFSENGVTHWEFVWGQFLDHTFTLRETIPSDDPGAEQIVIAFDVDDPLEDFTNDLGAITTTRSAFATGTGDDEPREQTNIISSYIDAFAVYGGTDERLDWLRAGVVDGDPANNDAALFLVDGFLPTAADRPGTEAPDTDLMGRLFASPQEAVVAGDVRVNENLGLTAVHTLFAREHNRIVDALPDDLDEQTKFAIARRVVAALQQYITYEEFLPSIGVELDEYEGYDPDVDPSITNEFATVGFRAHSQIHGEFEIELAASEADDAFLDELRAQGVTVELDGDAVELAIPLAVAFGNPNLVPELGLGAVLAGLASEAAYANDEQIDNQLRSVLFQIPGPQTENPLDCLDGEAIASCFQSVNDLGALDVIRGYDHGMPTYNDLRIAFGLDPVTSFVELTGEATDQFPDDPAIDSSNPIDDPNILDVIAFLDAEGNVVDADDDPVAALRRTSVAARLQAVFGDVDTVDAFTGMVSEPHVPGTEFGELQLTMWAEQFTALRDGDRFFYGNDEALDAVLAEYGIDYRRTLAEVITANTDVDTGDLPTNVFLLADAQVPTPSSPSDLDTETGDDEVDGDDDRERDGRRRDGDRPRRDRPRGDRNGN